MAEILEFKPNQFNGIVIAPSELPSDPDDFDVRLGTSIDKWSSEGFLAVWLEITKKQSVLISKAIERGFDFHHTGDE